MMNTLLEDSVIFAMDKEAAAPVQLMLNEKHVDYDMYDHPHNLMKDWNAQLYLKGNANPHTPEEVKGIILKHYKDFRDEYVSDLCDRPDTTQTDYEEAAEKYINDRFSDPEKTYWK